MNNGKIAWLHLSDVHVGHPSRAWDAQKVLDTLLPAIGDAIAAAGVAPSLLFFTGDLAFGQLPGKKPLPLLDQLLQGAALLKKIASSVSPPIGVENIFLVPGNHDIDRTLISDGVGAMMKGTDFVGIQKMILDAAFDWRFVTQRQSDYRTLILSEFPHLATDIERLCYSAVRNIGAVSVGIVGLNSAWSCGKEIEKGSLCMAGRYQAEILLPSISSTQLRILLTHHPSGWFIEPEESDFWRVIPQTEFDVHLHGHEHNVWVEASQVGHVRIAAGACYEASWKPTGFNVTVFDPTSKWGWVHLRKYDNKGRGWIPDSISKQTTPSGDWPIERFGRLHRSGEALHELIQTLRTMSRVSVYKDALHEEILHPTPQYPSKKGFSNIVAGLNRVFDEEEQWDGVITEIGESFGMTSDESLLRATQAALGLPSDLSPTQIKIAIIGPPIQGLKQVNVEEEEEAATADNAKHETDQILVQTISQFCPNCEIFSIVLARDEIDQGHIALALDATARVGGISVAILPYWSEKASEVERDACLDLLEKDGIVLIVPAKAASFAPKTAGETPIACRVQVDSRDPFEDSANMSLEFPFPTRFPALGVAAAFVSRIIQANGNTTIASASSVLRALYMDKRIHSRRFPDFSRVGRLVEAGAVGSSRQV